MSKVAFKYYYIANKLPTNLMLKAGYLTVKTGSYERILESDLEHPDILDAVTKGWAEVHSEVPDTSELPKAPEPVIEHEQYRGMTADELKASEPSEKTSGATSESIGRSPEVKSESVASSTAIGQTAEEANGVAEVEKAKRGRKAADKTE
jgi:hypothetical protein